MNKQPKYLGRWHGGPSYAVSEELEPFHSVEAAKRKMNARYHNQDYPLTPCVEDDSMLLYDPSDTTNPVIRLSRGPKGGIFVERGSF